MLIKHNFHRRASHHRKFIEILNTKLVLLCVANHAKFINCIGNVTGVFNDH